MNIEINVGTTTEGVTFRLKSLQQLTRRGIRQGFFAMGDDFMRTLNRQVLRTPKTGRIYIRRTASGRRRRHRASAPGESHANRTGALRKSADYKLVGTTELRLGYFDNPPNYDVFVEHGTRRMKARPTIQNTVRLILTRARTNMEREITRAIDEGF